MYRRPDLYDAIYSFKDYEQEARLIKEIVAKHKASPGNKLLDIACGTGKHIEYLKGDFDCEGLDNSHYLIGAARKRNPESEFIEGDMRYFELGRWFDVVVCLFSAIGYVRTFEALESTLRRFWLHTAPGGIAIVEPWIFPENWKPGYLGFDYVDRENYKVARMSQSEVDGHLSVLIFTFMLGTPEGIETWTERSELGLFTETEYLVAMERAGFEVTFDREGFGGRGLLIGKRPA